MEQGITQEGSIGALLGPLNAVEEKYAPSQVFFAGNPEIFLRGARVAIVGTRQASAEGAKRARKLAAILAKRGHVVVSGLALGIDTAAHQSAIASGGKTVAVVGTPLDRAYPAENHDLQAAIMRDHLCLSQFSPGTPTHPRNFPIRNRTMALVSDAVVIIEAGSKSGTINQGWEALRLGRGLFLAKSLTQNRSLAWPHEMLHYGAQELSDDSLQEFLDTLPARDPVWAEHAVPF